MYPIATNIYNAAGPLLGHFLFYDATVEYMGTGPQALWYPCLYTCCGGGSVVSTGTPVAVSNAVVPKVSEQVWFEQPRSSDVHAVFPRVLLRLNKWWEGVQIFCSSVSCI